MKIRCYFVVVLALTSFACDGRRKMTPGIPKLKGYVIVQEHGVEVFNEDEFDYTQCHVDVGPYRGQRSNIKLKSHSSIKLTWSEFHSPWWDWGAPPIENASIGWLNPQILECSEGGRRGAIE